MAIPTKTAVSAPLPSVIAGQKLAATFKPPFGLSGGDPQTILGSLAKRSADVSLKRTRIDLEDGDFLDLDEMSLSKPTKGETPTLSASSPVVLLVHGLGGSSSSQYVKYAAVELLKRGCRPVAMNLRGSSGEPNRAQRLYHAAAFEDVIYTVEHLFRAYPSSSRFGVIGFSLGGSITLNMMGRVGSDLDPKLICAAAVSPPIDLLKGADALENGAGKKWTRYLLGGLRNILKPRLETFDAPGVDAKKAYESSTIRAFDEHLIAPLHGYPDSTTYYLEASSGPFLQKIARPTMILRSRDDPFLAPSDVDIPELKQNEHIVPVLTEKGGHIGYVVSSGLGFAAWAEPMVAEWMSSILLSR